MDTKNEDRFLEQIDAELRSVNNRLKKVISDAQALLREYSEEGKEVQGSESESADEETTVCVEGPERAGDTGH
jgi:hypothetical protein